MRCDLGVSTYNTIDIYHLVITMIIDNEHLDVKGDNYNICMHII